MGTASTKKIIKQVSGALTEEAALLTSAGAGDANKIPALNASGVLDKTILGGVTTSAGAGDVDKPVLLDGAGRIDITAMPVGIGADTASIVTSEALSSGNYVNVWNNAGTTMVRKADATAAGKHAMGFVLAAFSSGATATVYFEGSNTQVTGQTGGDVFLSTTPGAGSATAPATAGNIVQCVGFAVSATSVNFQAARPVTLA